MKKKYKFLKELAISTIVAGSGAIIFAFIVNTYLGETLDLIKIKVAFLLGSIAGFLFRFKDIEF